MKNQSPNNQPENNLAILNGLEECRVLLGGVTKHVRLPLREGNQTEMAGSRIDILRITTY